MQQRPATKLKSNPLTKGQGTSYQRAWGPDNGGILSPGSGGVNKAMVTIATISGLQCNRQSC